MLKNKVFDLAHNNRSQFPTIDEAFLRVEEGYLLLRQLRDLKYPFAVRRGSPPQRSAMTTGATSRILRAKGRTYFFDIKKTNEGTTYLVITERRFRGNDQPAYQARIAVFPEDAEAFFEILRAMRPLVQPE